LIRKCFNFNPRGQITRISATGPYRRKTRSGLLPRDEIVQESSDQPTMKKAGKNSRPFFHLLSREEVNL
jgi:hypothetical protein